MVDDSTSKDAPLEESSIPEVTDTSLEDKLSEAEVNEDEVLSELDQLLEEEDPELSQSLSELSNELKDQDIRLDVIDFDGQSAGDESSLRPATRRFTQLVHKIPVLGKLFRYFGSLGGWFDRVLDRAFKSLLFLIKKLPFLLRDYLVLGLRFVTNQISQFIKYLRKRTRVQVAKAITAFAGLAICLWLLMKTFTGTLLPEPEALFLPSLFEKAQAVTEYNFRDESELESFYNSLRHTQSIILLDRMIVNLKASPGSGPTPMGVFEYYVETSNRDALFEIEARKSEMQDYMLRILEGFSYSDTRTEEGKNRMSKSVVSELNRHLTRGRVRTLYLKTFIIKP